MLKKTIEYVDYDDNKRKEDFYFNISKGELAMMEASKAGGFKKYLEKIAQTQDTVAVMEVFKDIIHMSYGEKSPDGKRFIKSEDMAVAFEQTEAYSELIMEILKSPQNAFDFVVSVLPAEIGKELAANRDNLEALTD